MEDNNQITLRDHILYIETLLKTITDHLKIKVKSFDDTVAENRRARLQKIHDKTITHLITNYIRPVMINGHQTIKFHVEMDVYIRKLFYDKSKNFQLNESVVGRALPGEEWTANMQSDEDILLENKGEMSHSHLGLATMTTGVYGNPMITIRGPKDPTDGKPKVITTLDVQEFLQYVTGYRFILDDYTLPDFSKEVE